VQPLPKSSVRRYMDHDDVDQLLVRSLFLVDADLWNLILWSSDS